MVYAQVTLPDGRKVNGKCQTTIELDGTFLIPDTIELEWTETGAELSLDEMNEELSPMEYLHEYVLENGQWEF